MAAALTLPVAVMHPTPPARRFASRNFSLPTKTSKPSFAKRSSMVFVFAKSPELSFIPATARG